MSDSRTPPAAPPSEELERLTKRLYARFKQASLEHAIVEPGDHVLVCLSGGKDSYTMLSLLRAMQRHVPFEFELTAFHLDQRQPGYPEGVMREYLTAEGIAHVLVSQDTYSVVTEKLDAEATPCSLCSRLRRGIIYAQAEALGCTKIALGHHREDSIETLLLNLLYAGQMQAMPARYTTDDGRFAVIRPLIYCAEEEIARYAELHGFPIIPCNLCGSHEGERKWVRGLLSRIEAHVPQARNSMLAALKNVRASHLLDLELQERLNAPSAGLSEGGAPDHHSGEDILRLVTNRPATRS